MAQEKWQQLRKDIGWYSDCEETMKALKVKLPIGTDPFELSNERVTQAVDRMKESDHLK